MTKMMIIKQPFNFKKINLKLYFLFALIVFISSCKTPDLVLSDNLQQNTTVLEVTGRQGWQYNQVLKFGEFKTSKIKRGWNLGYNFPFVVSFKEAKEKLNFTQQIPSGKEAQVLCVGKFKNTEVSLIDDFFAITLKHEDYFAGTVKKENLNWDFIIYEPDGNSLKDITSGYIRNQNNKDETIKIKAIKKVKGQANWVGIDVNGYEFIKNGKSIGAVSLLNNGRVWINNKTTDDTKLVLSSIMSSLMVRHSLSESLNE